MRTLTICAIVLVALSAAAFEANKRIDSTRAAAFDSTEPQAQAPGWSRGQQNLAITYDDCVRRMSGALQAEGYNKDPNSAGNFVAGTKAVHTAVIICGPAPESRMLVQIVVASNGDGGARERQCLQAQMERPGSYSGCGGNTGGRSSGSVGYVGCFKDDSYTRDLNGVEWVDDNMTTQKCVNYCQGKGYTYAGTQYSRECWCGNSYGKYGSANNCDMRCSGDPSQTCGGFAANSVYRVR